MGKRYDNNSAKKFSVPASKAKIAEDFCDLNQISTSSLLREWLESYIERGTDYVPEETKLLQTVVPPEIVKAAQERADAEGIKLRDMILFEIDEISKL